MLLSMILAGCGGNAPPQVEPAGRPESTTTDVLEAGAELVQRTPPLRKLDVYLDGFHVMKSDPDVQVEAHHFCAQKTEDLMQCVIFDGNTPGANLVGVEYIISERLFDDLDPEEKELWHPHNYEILSGALIAPGIPAGLEKQLMKGKMNSYGKTWHLWDTGPLDSLPDEPIPLGEPRLAWSFNADGEMKPELLEQRDDRMDVDTTEIRERRKDLVPYAGPQEGVDALKDAFERTGQPEGVEAQPAS